MQSYRKRVRGRGNTHTHRERERPSICLLIPQMIIINRAGSGGSQELRALLRSPIWVAGAQTLGLLSAELSRYIRGLDPN